MGGGRQRYSQPLLTAVPQGAGYYIIFTGMSPRRAVITATFQTEECDTEGLSTFTYSLIIRKGTGSDEDHPAVSQFTTRQGQGTWLPRAAGHSAHSTAAEGLGLVLSPLLQDSLSLYFLLIHPP